MLRSILLLIAFVLLQSVFCDVPDRRIIGGNTDNADEAPYMASLETTAYFHFCGASIISGHYVVTAAHCLVDRLPQFTLIVTGMIDLGERGVSHVARRFISHPNFNSNSMVNDIALIESDDVIVFRPLVQKIPIGNSHIIGGSIGMLHGWGYISYPNIETPILLKAIPLDVLTNSDCRARSSGNIATMIGANNLCTYTRAGQGACIGDAGSPLIINYRLHGIASWGFPCGQGLPDVYIRVSEYYDWIFANSDAEELIPAPRGV